MTIAAHRPDQNPQASPGESCTQVQHLQKLLATAIRQRDHLRICYVTTLEGHDLVGRHWYVEQDGYCAACGLPETNRRHAERVA